MNLVTDPTTGLRRAPRKGRRWQAAVHEAGHVVAALDLGLHPESADIEEHESGSVEGATEIADLGQPLELSVIMLAGDCARYRAMGRSARWHSETRARVERLCSRMRSYGVSAVLYPSNASWERFLDPPSDEMRVAEQVVGGQVDLAAAMELASTLVARKWQSILAVADELNLNGAWTAPSRGETAGE